MLVVSRYVKQRIFVALESGEQIIITLTEIDRRQNKCRIGISAPKHIRIVREELLAKTQEINS